jgi:hypothetical protein
MFINPGHPGLEKSRKVRFTVKRHKIFLLIHAYVMFRFTLMVYETIISGKKGRLTCLLATKILIII